MVECADGTFYTGWTTNPKERVKAHNTGKGAKYTRVRRPVKLIYVEELPDRSSALKREWAIKKLSRKQKEMLIQ
jgi:putative endonuclease